MQDLARLAQSLRRPALLVRAARAGQADYDRGRHLRRIVRSPDTPSPADALALLLDEEERLEAIRRAGDASYRAARHIEVLIATLGEFRLWTAAQA